MQDLKMNKSFKDTKLSLSAEMAKLAAAKVKFQDFHFEVELGVNGLGMPWYIAHSNIPWLNHRS